MNDSNPSALDLADQFGITDPNARRLLEFMSQQEAPDQLEQQATDAAALHDEAVDEALKELLNENRELQEENEYLVDRIEVLAAALGACALCWGEDPRCEECDGRGVPGSSAPHREAFTEYVLPTVRRIRGRQVARRQGQQKRPQHDEDVAKTTPDKVRRAKEKY